MKIHFIAIGGSVMHQIAIMMKNKGYEVSGSDDEIFEPSFSNLKSHGIIDDKYEWNTTKITPDLDAVILGMHAHANNIELQKAQELGLQIYSFPEYIFEQTKNKQRIIIGGSHGKTTTTAMLIHTLFSLNRECDYLVGAKILNLDYGISLQENTTIFVGEGDEYLASKLKPQPKFHFYKPHIAVLTGIAWDHINVFPTVENYVLQFDIFINTIESGGTLIFNQSDEVLKQLVENNLRTDIKRIPYTACKNFIDEQDQQIVQIENQQQKMNFFGDHNFQNMSAAYCVSNLLGITTQQFLTAMAQFKGVDKRLQLLHEQNDYKIFRDFAHSPSKVKATLIAVKNRFSTKKIIAVFELHTYSSLTENFLKEYKDTLNQADVAIVYYSAHALAIKKLTPLDDSKIKDYFNAPNAHVLNTKESLANILASYKKQNTVMLLMSSGNFDNLDIKALM